MEEQDKFLRADQVAKRMGVTAGHVRRLRRDRKLFGIKFSERRILFQLEDVKDFLRKLNQTD